MNVMTSLKINYQINNGKVKRPSPNPSRWLHNC